MQRDYARLAIRPHRRRYARRRGQGSSQLGLLLFIAIIGCFVVGGLVFLHHHHHNTFRPHKISHVAVNHRVHAEPQYDFYKMLPKLKVENN